MRRCVALLPFLVTGAAFGLPGRERPQVFSAERQDVSAPLFLLPVAPAEAGEVEMEERGPRPLPRTAEAAPPERDPVVQSSVAPLLMPPMATNFDGVGSGFLGASTRPFEVMGVPPDTQGDVGPNHYVQIVNSSFAVFAKDGRVLFGPAPTRTVFANFGGACDTVGVELDGDGIVLYDPLADRWLISQFVVLRTNAGRPFHQCIAVSRTGDPTGQWARYDYSFIEFHDYPKFGVWPDAYYATYNLFANVNSDVFHGIAYCALDRAKMLVGEPAAQQCITIHDDVSGIVPADLDGPLPPLARTPNTAVGYGRNSDTRRPADSLMLYRFRVDWGPALDSFIETTSLAVATFAEACGNTRSGGCIPQPGPGAPGLDALRDRMMFRAAYRNLGRRDSLVVNHAVTVNGVIGVRWYEIRDPGGLPSLVQQGTYAPDGAFRWMASAASDRAGNVALGFSISSSTTRPSIGYTGHAVTDGPGEMGQGEAMAVNGGGSQAGSLRWGDYSSMSVDPVDECTFWYTNEYIASDGAFNWRTRIFSFQLPGCAAAPDYAVWPRGERETVGRGYTTKIPLDTAALGPAASAKMLALSITNMPAQISSSIDPPSVVPGQSATLSINAAPGAELGRGQAFAVSATATDGNVAVASGILDVVDSDFSLQVEHTEVLIAAGATTTMQIDTRPLFGPPELITLSAVGLRTGITATFDPPRVFAGERAKMIFTGSNSLPSSNAVVKVVADAASTTHQVVLDVRALETPHAEISWPGAQEALSGNAQVIATAVSSPATSLQRIELLVDGNEIPGVFSTASPALLTWNTHQVSDGLRLLSVRATDKQGGTGESEAVRVIVHNKGDCGCSAGGGGWESLGLLALLSALRRRTRPRSPGAPPSSASP